MKKITLKHAIKVDGDMIKELEIQDPDLGCLDDVMISINMKGEVVINLGDIPVILSNLCNIPLYSAKQVKFADIPQVAMVVKDFLGESLPIGGT